MDNIKCKVTIVDFTGDVPKVYYQDVSGSPTASEMEPPTKKLAWPGILKVNKSFEPNPTIYKNNGFLLTTKSEESGMSRPILSNREIT